MAGNLARQLQGKRPIDFAQSAPLSRIENRWRKADIQPISTLILQKTFGPLAGA
jgi:hypothetical protein